MNKMTQLVQDYDYLTPKMAEKSGISKFKFYKYVHENGLEQVGHGIYTSGEEWVDVCASSEMSKSCFFA